MVFYKAFVCFRRLIFIFINIIAIKQLQGAFGFSLKPRLHIFTEYIFQYASICLKLLSSSPIFFIRLLLLLIWDAITCGMIIKVQILFFVCATGLFKGWDYILHWAIVILKIIRNLSFTHLKYFVWINNFNPVTMGYSFVAGGRLVCFWLDYIDVFIMNWAFWELEIFITYRGLYYICLLWYTIFFFIRFLIIIHSEKGLS